MTLPTPAITARAIALFDAARQRPGVPDPLPERLFLVDVERQTATLIENGAAVAAWPVSTARNGIGGENNSFKTPPGWHRIDAKIGMGAGAGVYSMVAEPEVVERRVEVPLEVTSELQPQAELPHAEPPPIRDAGACLLYTSDAADEVSPV